MRRFAPLVRLILLAALPARAQAASAGRATASLSPTPNVLSASRPLVISASEPLAPIAAPAVIASAESLTARIAASADAQALAPGQETEPARPALQSLEELLSQLKTKLDDAPGPETVNPGDIAMLGARGGTLTVDNGSGAVFPTLVRVGERADADIMVDIPVSKAGWTAILPQSMPREEVIGLAKRPVDSAVRDLRLSISRHTSFEPGETVRFRDEFTGLIGRATFLGLADGKNRKFAVRGADGVTHKSPVRLVFKDPGVGEPSTLRFPANFTHHLWAAFESRRGDTLENFLDGAAWIGSHPEFLAASHQDRWKTLTRYVGSIVRPGMEAALAEKLDLGFPDLLKLGFGVCRHFSSLTAAVLRESGYDARIMSRAEANLGHAWVEVRAPSGSDIDPWILDLSNAAVFSMNTAGALARLSHKLSIDYYLHPERAEYPPSAVPAPKLVSSSS